VLTRCGECIVSCSRSGEDHARIGRREKRFSLRIFSVPGAAQHYGVTGVGITLSERQCDYARQWIAAGQLAGKVDIRLQDYRDLRSHEQFDKIVSVGMYDASACATCRAISPRLSNCCGPGGAFLNHGIFSADADGRAQGPPGGEFINRYVFPGGAVPHLSRATFEMLRAGLEFADAEDLRPALRAHTHALDATARSAPRPSDSRRRRRALPYLAGLSRRHGTDVRARLAFNRADSGVPACTQRSVSSVDARVPVCWTGRAACRVDRARWCAGLDLGT
jgi:hypothetical protein